jgi:hypothetical protein
MDFHKHYQKNQKVWVIKFLSQEEIATCSYLPAVGDIAKLHACFQLA